MMPVLSGAAIIDLTRPITRPIGTRDLFKDCWFPVQGSLSPACMCERERETETRKTETLKKPQ